MPVLVTRADHELGAAVVRRLLPLGGQVRAWCTGGPGAVSGPGELRGAGAVVASGDIDDEGLLERAMAQVHTVLHCDDGQDDDDPARLRAGGEAVVRAASGAGVARLVVTSVHGADPTAADPLRAAHGEIEARCVEAPVASVAVRTSLVDREGVRDVLAAARLSDEDLERRVAPVAVPDLADLLVAIDDARGARRGGHLRLAADGDVTTLGRWLAAVHAAPGTAGRLVGRVWRPGAAHALCVQGLAGPWTLADDRADVPVDDAWPLFDLG